MEQTEMRALASAPSLPGGPTLVCEESRTVCGAQEHRFFLPTLAFLLFITHTSLFAIPGFHFYCFWTAYYWLHHTIQGSSLVPPPPRSFPRSPTQNEPTPYTYCALPLDTHTAQSLISSHLCCFAQKSPPLRSLS